MIKTKQETIEQAISFFDEGYACSQSILLAFAEDFNIDANMAKLISSSFGGGMGRLRQKCGALTGGFMVIGLAFGNTYPKDMETKLNAYKKVRELNKQIEDIHGVTDCSDLLKKNVTKEEVEERKHHAIICRNVVADVAGVLFEIIEQSRMNSNIK